MIPSDARAALEGALGEGGVEEREPFDVDGAKLAVTLRPADPEALAAALATLARGGLAALVEGGGTRSGTLNPPRRADVLLSTRRLAGLLDFDPEEGVCRARAGTPLASVRSAVNAEGWELPLDPPGAGSTVGGVIASAALGPRAQAFGLPRDLVLGLEVSLADGSRTRCGGRVVKNVTGYDLSKLYTGSFGTLGVIEAAWLRLRPLPEESRCLSVRLSDPEAAPELALRASRRIATRGAALWDDDAGLHLAVELAGDAAAVASDAAWCEAELGAREDAAGLDRARARQSDAAGEFALRFRIGVLPSALPHAVAALRAAGARVLALPGLRLAYAGFPDTAVADAGAIEAAFAAARAAGGGSAVCESAPLAVRSGRDVFDPDPGALTLMRALKQRFDPTGVLNPGRFAGRL